MAKTRAKAATRRSAKITSRKAGKKSQAKSKKSKKKPAKAAKKKAAAKPQTRPRTTEASGFKVLAQLAVAAPSALADAVKLEIRAACPAPPREITDGMDLSDDLRLTNDLKRGLAGAFQQIARRFKPGARISLDDCGGLTDVASAIALVAKRAGF